ncbi:MAG TPA: thioredoxin domain-containing protein [Anaerolineae bacterium]|nr:thioredoxin domain-containing protein [Anaerolineae bacterium]
MKSTSRPVKKKQTGLAAIPASYWLIGIIAVMVALALIVLLGLPAAATNTAKAIGNSLGDANAPVQLEVYADFQCPICGQFDRGTLKQIEDKYVNNGKVRIIFNHFAFIGNESTRAAEASECANAQGKFWQYADTLFNNQAGENQGAFSDANLEKFAQQVGLDMTQYKTCMDQDTYLGKIQTSSLGAQQRGVDSTPTLFINGQKVVGNISLAQFESIAGSQLRQ